MAFSDLLEQEAERLRANPMRDSPPRWPLEEVFALAFNTNGEEREALQALRSSCVLMGAEVASQTRALSRQEARDTCRQIVALWYKYADDDGNYHYLAQWVGQERERVFNLDQSYNMRHFGNDRNWVPERVLSRAGIVGRNLLDDFDRLCEPETDVTFT